MTKDEIRALLNDLESDRVERTISTTNTDKFGQAICAFANDLPDHRLPGYLFLGVKDDGEVKGLDVTDDLIVSNYYGYEGAGNHRVGNFIEALNDLDMDFEIVKFEPKNPNEEYSANHVWVQTDNMKALNAFSVEANDNAIKHDQFFGDGRYEDSEISKRLNIVKQALTDFNTDKSSDKTYDEKRKAMEDKLNSLAEDKGLTTGGDELEQDAESVFGE